METYLLNILTILYGLGGIVTFIGYIPTIKDLLHKKASANVQTYTIWTITMFLATLYGYVVLKDLAYIFVTNLNFLACAIILGLRIRLKYGKK
jgi:hypothetical protein